jgi:hypothetical protein
VVDGRVDLGDGEEAIVEHLLEEPEVAERGGGRAASV